MSDYMAGEIKIGGQVSAELVPALCAAIKSQGASLEWGDGFFTPESAEDLLAGCRDENGVRLLYLCDDDVRGGVFECLEEFLQNHGIAYWRHSEAKYEFDAQILEYRPGFDPVSISSNAAGDQLMAVSNMAVVDKALDAAQRKGSLPAARQAIRKAQRLLRAQLPPALPPLESFEIVDDCPKLTR